MSGITGIYSRNGYPTTRQHLLQMMDTVKHRGPHGMDTWVDSDIALGHQLLVTTPESVGEKQPLVDSQSGLVIVFDGRIDNRAELHSMLKMQSFFTDPITDAEYALKAYARWGADALPRIQGDFAFAIWNQKTREIFCARDVFGIKPFYYHLSERVFVFGSQLRAVLEHPLVGAAKNEGMIAEHLTNLITSKTETLYQDILRLPPAHYLQINTERSTKKQYWDLAPKERIWYRDDQQYADHFLEIFSRSVGDRLRCNGVVGADLSGGLDSSSIVGMAQYLKEQGKAAGVETFSLTFPGIDCDESDYINSVLEKWKPKSFIAEFRDNAHLVSQQQAAQSMELPPQPNLSMHGLYGREAQSRGVNVILCGIGGDELFAGSQFPYLDLFRSGRLKDLGKTFQTRAGGGWLRECKRLSADMLWPMFSSRLRRGLLAWRRNPTMPPWISKKWLDSVLLDKRVKEIVYGEQFPSLSDRAIYYWLTCAYEAHVFEEVGRFYSYFSIEYRYPFLDRQLAEFAIAIPEQQKRGAGGQTKHILRNAGKSLLPDKVRTRESKGEFSAMMMEAMQHQRIKDNLINPHDAGTNWWSGERVRGYYREMLGLYGTDNSDYKEIYRLWSVCAVNLWLENLQSGDI